MLDSVDLEIGLHRRYGETWTVELQCSLPDEDVDVRLVREGPRFDLDELRGLVYDDAAYGRLLSRGRVVQDRAVRVDPGAVTIASGERIPADYIVLASGSSYPFPAKMDVNDSGTSKSISFSPEKWLNS